MSLSLLRRAVIARSTVSRSLAASRTYASHTQKEEDPQLNGYPDLPDIPRAKTHPTGWFDNLTRTNYGQTLHPREEVLSMWGPDAPVIDPKLALRYFLVAASGFVAAGFAIKAITPEPSFIRREYPYDGLVKELGGLEETKARPETVDTDN